MIKKYTCNFFNWLFLVLCSITLNSLQSKDENSETLTTSSTYMMSHKGESVMPSKEFLFVLQPSPQGNIGLFAACDIPKGTLLMDKPFELRIMNTNDIPAQFKQFSLEIDDEHSACLERFDRMEIGWYMNHSDDPNIEKRIDIAYDNVIELLKALTFYAIKDIKVGDEILIDLKRVQQQFPPQTT